MKKVIKHVCLLFVCLGIITSLFACVINDDGDGKVNAPVLHGVEDITIEKGSAFLPREGVTATDEEDGTINPSAINVDTKGFNANVEGTYVITYTVYDSDGNMTVVERKVTVVYTDVTKPTLYGVADATLLIGADFTVTKDVSAIDNVDGDLTKDIKIEGNVNVWVPDTYKVKYSVSDKAGNKNEIERTVVVEEGNFKFDELQDFTIPGSLNGGEIYDAIASYSLIKVEYVAVGAKSKLTIGGTTCEADELDTVQGQTYVKYFRFEEPLTSANVEASDGLEAIKYAFAKAGDTVAPVITRSVEGDVYVPVNAPAELVQKELLRGITAEDNLEGNVTANLSADLSKVDLAQAGSYKVKVECADSFDNVADIEVTLVVAKVKDTQVLTDPEFNDSTNTQWVCTHNSGGSVVEEIKDGMYVLNITTAGGWASGDSPYLSGINTTKLQAGNWYMFKMDVKADAARAMQIRGGLELWSDPWIENFRDVTRYQITTEWTTIYYIFYCGSSVSADGSNNVKFEIQLGSIDWAASENNNVVYLDNAQFYLLSNDAHAPEITIEEGIKTTYGAGEQLIDYKPFIKISDVEDGEIEVTDAMIDASKVDMTKAGEYELIINVTDADGSSSTGKIAIKVLAEADTEGPQISIPDIVFSLVAGAMPAKEGISMEAVFAQVLGATTILDNVDGVIAPSLDMVDLQGLDIKTPKPGTYNISISCKDSSGNESNSVGLTITVVDAVPPTLVGVHDLFVVKGQMFNPLLGVQGVDTTDGIINLQLSNLVGFEQFLDQTGKVVGDAKQYQVSYKVADSVGNEATANAVVTVLAEAPEIHEENVIDLLAQKKAPQGGETTAVYNQDGTCTFKYAGVYAWYASGTQLKYSDVKLEADQTYIFQFEAKAELPREIVIYFVDGDGNKIPGFEGDGTITKLKVGITTEYYVYQYIFTPTSASSGACIFELDWDWESYLLNSDKAQDIEIKQLKLIKLGEYVAPVVPTNEVLHLDFEDGAGSDKYVNDKWTQYKYTDSWVALTSNQMNSRSKNGSKVANGYSGYSTSYKYIYNETGTPIGSANHFEIMLGNYYGGIAYKVKVAVMFTDGSLGYVLGSADQFYEFPVTTGLDKYELNFDEKEVQGFYVVLQSASDSYIYMDDAIFTSSLTPAPKDTIPPVINLNPMLLVTLVSMKFVEGADITALLTQIADGVTISDNVDGNIPFDMSMLDLGGLNPAKLVAGTYKIAIKAKDAAGNESKFEFTAKVDALVIPDANLSLDFEDLKDKVGQDYFDPSWTVYMYTTDWNLQTSATMRVKEKNGTTVVNMQSGYSMSYKYIYNENGAPLGKANHFEVKIGNYFSGLAAPIMLYLVDTDGNRHYLAGDLTSFVDFPVTDGLVLQSFDFDEIVVQQIVVEFKSPANGSAYIYIDDVKLSKAAQLAKVSLDFEELTRGTDYTGSDWTMERYEGSGWKQLSGQIRIREKNGSTVINAAVGYSMDERVFYKKDCGSLGLANHFSIDLGNYFSGAADCPAKIAVVDTKGDVHFLFGSSTEYGTIPVGTDLVTYEYNFDDVEVAYFYIQLKSPLSGGGYIYMDNVILSYEPK